MPHPRKPRGGYTLTEMLVVVTILVILIAAALPTARHVMEASKVKEASRQLQAYFAMARSRAAQTGRPCGLWIEVSPQVGGAPDAAPLNPVVRQATKFFLAEVPPYYAGSVQNMLGRIRDTGTSGTNRYVFEPTMPNTSGSGPAYVVDPVESATIISLLNLGEVFLVRFDNKGEWYQCVYNGSAFIYQKTLSGIVTFPPGGFSADNPGCVFQLVRAPRRVGNPLELTAGACIDMSYSGMGPTDRSFNIVRNNLVILFQPSGAMAGMYVDLNYVDPNFSTVIPVYPNNPGNAFGTCHFLVGRVEKVNAPLGANTNHPSGLNFFDPATSNLADTASLWVSVGRQNGTVTTADNLPNLAATDYSATGQVNYLATARENATNREQTGGQ
ncbi:MAG: prepilin-type N-terminal cleavage/methylation domain-containing protein [Pirellulaceae bacterium]|nr:prepilin-type N-terminal cleavage/methylation domain-containing protein [Pirellulaceae bacterium]